MGANQLHYRTVDVEKTTQGDGPGNCDGSLERNYKGSKRGCRYPTHSSNAACSAIITSALGWCSWLSRVPHTHKVTSSILVPSTFVCLAVRGLFRVSLRFVARVGGASSKRLRPQLKRSASKRPRLKEYSSRESNSGPSVC